MPSTIITKLLLGLLSTTTLAAPILTSITPTTNVSLSAATQNLQDTVDSILSAVYGEEGFGVVPRTATASSEASVVGSASLPSTTSFRAGSSPDARWKVQDAIEPIQDTVYYGQEGSATVSQTRIISSRPSTGSTTGPPTTAFICSEAAQAVKDIIMSMQLPGDGFVHIADDGIARSYDERGVVVDYCRLSNDQLRSMMESLPPSIRHQQAHLKEVYEGVDGHDVTDKTQIWDPPPELRPFGSPRPKTSSQLINQADTVDGALAAEE